MFDKRAVDRRPGQFSRRRLRRGRAGGAGLTATVTLKDFGVFYRQDDVDALAAELKPGGSKVTVESGQVVKVTKDKHGHRHQRDV